MSNPQIPENFCPIPWMEAYFDTIGDVRACCLERGNDPVRLYNLSEKEKWEFFNSDHFTSLRKSFLENEKPARCVNCWTTEAQGLTSGRQRALYKYRDQLNGIVEAASLTATSPVRMDLRFSNKCNIQCKMCTPSNSNQISGLVKRMRAQGLDTTFTGRVFRDDNQSEFLNRYIQDHDSVVEFLFAGGEPFVMPEFDQFLTAFIENGRAAKTRLHIVY
jgi:MoaA/NifB/PqqE/SkfB family radical SAM enzyme